MEAVLDRPKQKVLTLPFTRKLTPEELDELLDNWEYDPNRYDDYDDDDEIRPVYDRYGNPTVETMDAMYESLHGLGEETTLEELQAWVDSL
ncbi:MAG: hypothetical protein IJR85_02985 [Synergistaceae bacterium]|nr:hypothetical protein [Synergistaceae bacterium]